jgi:D-arabinose 1-dehydrogenase-like Zn-dependent alcohol dehydrogenase
VTIPITGCSALAAMALHAMIETMPLERANDAYERMMSGAARFRMVLAG